MKRFLTLSLILLTLGITIGVRPLRAEGIRFDPAISGDICYDLREQALGYGPSYTIGTFHKEMFEIKGMWVVFEKENIPNKLGAGISASIPKVLKSVGVQGIPDWFNTSVGILGLVNLDAGIELSLGVYLTLIKLPL